MVGFLLIAYTKLPLHQPAYWPMAPISAGVVIGGPILGNLVVIWNLVARFPARRSATAVGILASVCLTSWTTMCLLLCLRPFNIAGTILVLLAGTWVTATVAAGMGITVLVAVGFQRSR
jgi:hypothetical protein